MIDVRLNDVQGLLTYSVLSLGISTSQPVLSAPPRLARRRTASPAGAAPRPGRGGPAVTQTGTCTVRFTVASATDNTCVYLVAATAHGKPDYASRGRVSFAHDARAPAPRDHCATSFPLYGARRTLAIAQSLLLPGANATQAHLALHDPSRRAHRRTSSAQNTQSLRAHKNVFDRESLAEPCAHSRGHATCGLGAPSASSSCTGGGAALHR